MTIDTKKQSVLVVGAGAVGVGMARALAGVDYQILGLWNRGEARRDAAAQLTDAPVFGGALASPVDQADIVLVCVTDDAVASVGDALRAGRSVRPGAVVAHTCGSLPAAALGPIPGAKLGSLHPLVAVPQGADGAAVLRGATFALEGDPAAVALLDVMVSALAGTSFEVTEEQKPHYHAAAVLASNLVVTLVGEAIREANEAGVKEAEKRMVELALGAVQRITEVGPHSALTGPVVRGDVDTVARHLAALGDDAAATYRAVSRRALAVARERGLAADRVEALERLLAGRGS